MCVWRRLGVRHKRLGVVKGVGRRASPRRLKNIGRGFRGFLGLVRRSSSYLECCGGSLNPFRSSFFLEVER